MTELHSSIISILLRINKIPKIINLNNIIDRNKIIKILSKILHNNILLASMILCNFKITILIKIKSLSQNNTLHLIINIINLNIFFLNKILKFIKIQLPINKM